MIILFWICWFSLHALPNHVRSTYVCCTKGPRTFNSAFGFSVPNLFCERLQSQVQKVWLCGAQPSKLPFRECRIRNRWLPIPFRRDANRYLFCVCFLGSELEINIILWSLRLACVWSNACDLFGKHSVMTFKSSNTLAIYSARASVIMIHMSIGIAICSCMRANIRSAGDG